MNPISSTSRYSPPPSRLAPNNLQREGQLTVEGEAWKSVDPALACKFGEILEKAVGPDEAEALLSQLDQCPAIIADLYEWAGRYFIKVHQRSSMLGNDLFIKKYDRPISELEGNVQTVIFPNH